MSGRRIAGALLLPSAYLPLGTPAANAQPLTHRTPNMEGTWVTAPWNLHFQFKHRFRVTGDDSDVIDLFDDGLLDNSPTFSLSLRLPFMRGVIIVEADRPPEDGR
jgi:hypothetical protein